MVNLHRREGMPSSAPLTPVVSAPTLLLTAAIARLAQLNGIRLVVIKGISATEYGLRRPRASSDVDVLVSRDDHDPLVAALETKGWRKRAADPDTSTFPVHSVSMYHPEWAADVDVHFRYPGLEAPRDVFGLIWSQRTTMWCGNQPVCIPSLVDAIMIGAVHAIRSSRTVRFREELDFLVERCSRMDASLLIERAGELGAIATARPFLERLVPPRPDFHWGEPSEEWRLRTEFPEPSERRVLVWLRATPRERLSQFRLAVFPPVTALVKETTRSRLGPRELVVAYLRRWVRGARALPRALAVAVGRRPRP